MEANEAMESHVHLMCSCISVIFELKVDASSLTFSLKFIRFNVPISEDSGPILSLLAT